MPSSMENVGKRKDPSDAEMRKHDFLFDFYGRVFAYMFPSWQEGGSRPLRSLYP